MVSLHVASLNPSKAQVLDALSPCCQLVLDMNIVEKKAVPLGLQSTVVVGALERRFSA